MQNIPAKKRKYSDHLENKCSTKRTCMSPLAVWDLTLKKTVEPTKVIKDLKTIAKKWVFQLEKGDETGYVHYQIRINLFKKKRKNELLNLLKDTHLESAFVCITSNKSTKDFNYQLKKDTRIDGPWKDDDPELEEMDEELKLVPNKFQKDLIDLVKGEIHMRKITVVVDLEGGKGKTWLMKYLRFHKLATVIPSFEKMEDISQMVMCKPVDRAYVIDMPRSINPKKMAGFWSGIESIKNGYCYDKRHNFKDRCFKAPHVIVLTNKLPEREHLSDDRWNIIRI